MSQDDTINTATLPDQDLVPVDPEALVGTYADSLMTGLFEDVDRLLDGDEMALAAITVVAQPLAAEEHAETVDAGVETSASLVPTARELDFFTPAPSNPDMASAAMALRQPKTRLGKLVDRLLLTTTAVSLLGIAVFIWLKQPNHPELALSTGPTATAGQSDGEFLNYLQRSLEVIATKAKSAEANIQPGTAQGGNVSVIPVTPPLLPPLAASAGGPVNVIERVYVPYQTAQQPTAPGARSPAAALPTVNNPAATAPQTVAATPIQTLVGVLELGDRSAALFEISGVPQRVYIGERVGNSGWSLVSVSNEEAVIRRNGEVRSVYIGQQF
ncbi:MAG: hypothetical protein ACFCVD_03455 [Nodosilinea sp.]